jgi:predicted anti-sigma-YlaC factor YlaD
MREPDGCPLEARVVEARRGHRDEELVAAHLASCSACRDLLDVLDVMETLSTDPEDAAHRLPDAAQLWFRAQLVRRWAAERKSAEQLDRLYPLQAGVMAASVVVGVLVSWPVVERWVSATELGGATLLAASLLPAGMVTALVGGAVLLAILSLLLMRDLVAERG